MPSTGVGPRPVTPAGILAARLDDLARRIAASPGVDPALAAEAGAAAALAGGLEPYLAACTTPESPALARLDAETRGVDWSDAGEGADRVLEQEMLSGHVEGQFLKFLVHATGARRILEIGLFTGYSALAMAEALPAGGDLVACEIDPRAATVAARCLEESEAGAKVRIEIGPAGATLERLAAAGESFDLVFVDADKGGYLAYLHAVVDSELLAPGGIVCVDNTLMQGLAYGAGEPTENGDAIAAFNAAVAADPRLEQVLVPLRDGITLIRRA